MVDIQAYLDELSDKTQSYYLRLLQSVTSEEGVTAHFQEAVYGQEVRDDIVKLMLIIGSYLNKLDPTIRGLIDAYDSARDAAVNASNLFNSLTIFNQVEVRKLSGARNISDMAAATETLRKNIIWLRADPEEAVLSNILAQLPEEAAGYSMILFHFFYAETSDTPVEPGEPTYTTIEAGQYLMFPVGGSSGYNGENIFSRYYADGAWSDWTGRKLMSAFVYDPNNKREDIFNYADEAADKALQNAKNYIDGLGKAEVGENVHAKGTNSAAFGKGSSALDDMYTVKKFTVVNDPTADPDGHYYDIQEVPAADGGEFTVAGAASPTKGWFGWFEKRPHNPGAASPTLFDYVYVTPQTRPTANGTVLHKLIVTPIEDNSTITEYDTAYEIAPDVTDKTISQIVNVGGNYLDKYYDAAYVKFNIAYGENSATSGEDALATGASSHAEGLGTVANSDGQTVVGRFNEIDSGPIFAVGTGTDDEARKTMFAVKEDGVYADGINLITNALLTFRSDYSPSGALSIDDMKANGWTKVSDLPLNRIYAVPSTLIKYDEDDGTIDNDTRNLIDGFAASLPEELTSAFTLILFKGLPGSNIQNYATYVIVENGGTIYYAFRANSPNLSWHKLVDSSSNEEGLGNLLSTALVRRELPDGFDSATSSSMTSYKDLAEAGPGYYTISNGIQLMDGPYVSDEDHESIRSTPTILDGESSPLLSDSGNRTLFVIQGTSGVTGTGREYSYLYLILFNYQKKTIHECYYNSLNRTLSTWTQLGGGASSGGSSKEIGVLARRELPDGFDSATSSSMTSYKDLAEAGPGYYTISNGIQLMDGPYVSDEDHESIRSTPTILDGESSPLLSDSGNRTLFVIQGTSGVTGTGREYSYLYLILFNYQKKTIHECYYNSLNRTLSTWTQLGGGASSGGSSGSSGSSGSTDNALISNVNLVNSNNLDSLLNGSAIPEWSSSNTYSVGDYVYRTLTVNGTQSKVRYRCKTAVETATNKYPTVNSGDSNGDATHWRRAALSDLPTNRFYAVQSNCCLDNMPKQDSPTSDTDVGKGGFFVNMAPFSAGYYNGCFYITNETDPALFYALKSTGATLNWQSVGGSDSSGGSGSSSTEDDITLSFRSGTPNYGKLVILGDSITHGYVSSDNNKAGGLIISNAAIAANIQGTSLEGNGDYSGDKHRSTGEKSWAGRFKKYIETNYRFTKSVKDWSSAKTYAVGDYVKHLSKYYSCISAVNPASADQPQNDTSHWSEAPAWADTGTYTAGTIVSYTFPLESRVVYYASTAEIPEVPDWSSGTDYVAWHHVKHNAGAGYKFYKCIADISSSVTAPNSDSPHWQEIDVKPYLDRKRWRQFSKVVWSASGTYDIGIIVKYPDNDKGKFYECISEVNTASATVPGSDSIHWKQVNATDTSLVMAPNPRITVIDNAIPSWGTFGIARNINDLVPNDTTMVIVCIGINDRNNDIGTLKTNYGSLIDGIRGRGVNDIVMLSPPETCFDMTSIPYGSAMARVNTALEQVCIEKGVKYVNLYSEYNAAIAMSGTNEREDFFGTTKDGIVDNVHPSDLGHKVIFGIVCKALNF